MKRVLVALLPVAAHAGLSLAGADAGLRALSGQAVAPSELSWALAYMAVYAVFVLVTPVLVLSVALEPLVRALLRVRRVER